MNVKFDRLSRYPYEGEKMREIISEHLTDEEIEYIIQYSIAPVHFMDYIECPSFNIYHIDQYNHTKDIAFYLSNEEVVEYTFKKPEALFTITKDDDGVYKEYWQQIHCCNFKS